MQLVNRSIELVLVGRPEDGITLFGALFWHDFFGKLVSFEQNKTGMKIAELNDFTGLGFLNDKRLQKVAILPEILLFLLFAKFEVNL